MLRLALVGLVSVATLACGPLVGPSLTVPMEPSEWGQHTLLIYDDSGLGTDARSALRQLGAPWAGVAAFPEQNELEIGWTGGACSHLPTLHVTGDASALRLTVANPTTRSRCRSCQSGARLSGFRWPPPSPCVNQLRRMP